MADREPNEYQFPTYTLTTTKTMCAGCCELVYDTKRNSDGEQMCPRCIRQMP